MMSTEAFKILKNLDISSLHYSECKPALYVAVEKKAWDIVIPLANKLLEIETKSDEILKLKLHLFNAYMDMDKFLDMISIGEDLLSNKDQLKLLDDKNQERLLANTIQARLKRAEYSEAKKLLEKHKDLSKTFEFKVGIEASVYIHNNDADKALDSIESGIKALNNPTPEQYGSLFFLFTTISNLTGFGPESQLQVSENSFVKLTGVDRWYYIGDGNELDASKIKKDSELYLEFINKSIGEEVIFYDKYRSNKRQYTIEIILPIKEYIYWQCLYYAKKLTEEQRWDQIRAIDIPKVGEAVDTSYIISFLKDERARENEFFNLYCKGNVPIAFLSTNLGSLTNAIELIQNENKGFINISTGDPIELENQKKVAKRILEGEPFYIDGTSAIFLSEFAMLKEIYKFITHIKIPQSVISLLFELVDKFKYTPGQLGYLGLVQGQIRVSSSDENKRQIIISNLKDCIKLFESNRKNIVAIPNANKFSNPIEQKVLPELCDACILAQGENVPVLTDDYLYLLANEIITKKKSPIYCSSFVLVRELYEQGKISYNHFLNYFSYLAYYRCRFLPISVDDLKKATLGDRDFKIINPERLRNFNLPLILSEEYGVTPEIALNIVATFLLEVLINDAILPHSAESIFIEVLNLFPTKMDKKTLGKVLLLICEKTILKQKKIIGIRTKEKQELLYQCSNVYNKNGIWTP